MDESRLFAPLKIGNIKVKHRIAMAPLTRLRADENRVPTAIMAEYYSQRASEPGTLLVSEGTFVSRAAGGVFPGAPGIWSEAQIAAWKTVVDAVHRKGSFIYLQLFSAGRVADAEVAANEGIDIKAPSAIPLSRNVTKSSSSRSAIPQPMTTEDVKQAIRDYATAARNAVEKAGFDGVECHGANGYLINQFLEDVSNQRTDAYGGSVANRSRFAIEVLEAVVTAVGPERVGFRLSPWGSFNDMGMATATDTEPQYVDVITRANRLGLAFLHLVEPRIAGAEEQESTETLDFAYKLWDGPLLVAGGHTLATAKKLVDEEYPDKDIVVVFGRHFISNPDLVFRIRKGLELAKYNRGTFYTNDAIGYLDYAFSPEFLASQNGSVSLVEETSNVEAVIA